MQTDATALPQQRLRLTFSKGGATRYISHLDLARALERSLNRARIPVAYTQGFNRRPRLSLAAALPLGYTSDAELADVWLTEPMTPRDFHDQLMARMAPGITVLRVEEVPLATPSLQQQITESCYVVTFLEPADPAALRAEVAALLAAETRLMQKQRTKARKPPTFDLRPLIHELTVEGEEPETLRLHMRLRHTPTQTGRPDDVLAALGLDPLDARVHRSEIRLAEPASPN